MKKAIRIIAGIQVILAIAFAAAAWNIDPGISKVSREFGKACHDLSGSIMQHKAFYQESMKNIFPLKDSLKDTGEKTEKTADAFQNAGKQLSKIRWFKKAGESIENTGNSLEKFGKSLKNQAGLCAAYEKDIYPKTLASFDQTARTLDQAEKALENLSCGTNSAVRLVIAISALLFLLNAMVFFLISGKLETEKI